eukprot:Lithocolla_globosa_v1_NODE_424_length_4101_cov_9.723431.p2 type:complete len:197 gc:universal NODE_424_length_4101_cov_9.723431:920-330(-)
MSFFGFLLVCFSDLSLFIRVFWLDFNTSRHPRPLSLNQKVVYSTRVWPSSLDLNRHAACLRELNFARRLYCLNMHIWDILREKQLNIVVTAQNIRYRRELTAFQTYDIIGRLLGWEANEPCFYLEFRFERKGFVHALQWTKYKIVGGKSKEGVVEDLLRTAGFEWSEPQSFPKEVDLWRQSNLVSSTSFRPDRKTD